MEYCPNTNLPSSPSSAHSPSVLQIMRTMAAPTDHPRLLLPQSQHGPCFQRSAAHPPNPCMSHVEFPPKQPHCSSLRQHTKTTTSCYGDKPVEPPEPPRVCRSIVKATGYMESTGLKNHTFQCKGRRELSVSTCCAERYSAAGLCLLLPWTVVVQGCQLQRRTGDSGWANFSATSYPPLP